MAVAERGRRWLPWAVAVLCLLPRLPGLDSPLLGNGHAWRQSLTAMMARNFARHGHRLAWAEVDMVAWDEHGIRRVPGYTDAEFPLYPWLVAQVYRVTGPELWVARLCSALCGVAICLCLFFLGRELWGDWAGAVAAGFFGLSPLAVFYTRAVLPEPLMYACAVCAVWQLVVWAQGDARARRALVVALVALTVAAMLKLTSLHLLVPAVVAGWLAAGRQAPRRAGCWLLVVVPVLATVAWYAWAYHLGQTYFSHFPILGSRAARGGLVNWDLWRKGVESFYPRFVFTVLILVGNITGWAVALLALGRVRDRREWVVWAWLGITLAQMVVLAGATISHFYYNLAFVLPLSLVIGRGASRWDKPRLRWMATVLALIGPVLTVAGPLVPSWYDVTAGEVAAARAANRLTAPDELIYTLSFGPQMLYEADRRGDFMLAQNDKLNPLAVRQAAAVGFALFATGRADLLGKPAGAALAAELARWPLVAHGPGWAVWDLRSGNKR